jgi:hypothetical protein
LFPFILIGVYILLGIDEHIIGRN